MLMTRREELLSILGALCVITIQLAEQISLWRHTLNSPMLIPLWHGMKYADKALKDGRELLMKAHALELFAFKIIDKNSWSMRQIINYIMTINMIFF